MGLLKRDEIIREIVQVFDVNPNALEVMRVDFVVDVPRLPVQWFRETVQVQHKRFRSAVTGERFYCEMGKGEIQTLYFGKRPNLIRIYDKQAECRDQFRKMGRDLGPAFETSFETVFPDAAKHPILTRVERQIGGRIPIEVATLGQIFESGYGYKPFPKLKIIDHAEPLERDSSVSFETYCTALQLRGIAERDGMQAVKEFISRQSKGNTSWAWNKYRSFLPSATADTGINGKNLQARFEGSMRRPMMPSG